MAHGIAVMHTSTASILIQKGKYKNESVLSERKQLALNTANITI